MMRASSSWFSGLSHHCCASITAISSALDAFGFLSTQARAHAERLLGMLVPELAGGDRGVADLLIDELQVPRLADAEAIHGADLHVRHHLRRRNGDGLDVLVGIDAAGGEPVADPEIVGAAGEGVGGLHRLAGGLLLLQRFLERLGVEPDLQVLVFLGDRDALAVELSRARMYIGVGTLFCVTLPAEIR